MSSEIEYRAISDTTSFKIEKMRVVPEKRSIVSVPKYIYYVTECKRSLSGITYEVCVSDRFQVFQSKKEVDTYINSRREYYLSSRKEYR